jgi:DNA repair protein SbcC/Rad50
MRPHRLRVTAFGAFAGTEQVVFDDLEGLFLLHGETGAGKTTLLDAIAFALYGRVPGERGSARRLRSDHAALGTATEVELEATIGGRRLRLTRRPEQLRQKKSGSGFTAEPASLRLAELSAADAWETKSTRIGEADAEIENLMGMSAAQFFQVVLLPQGEFARFLRADAKDKEALLQKLFGTDRFRRAEDWLADRRRATDKEVATCQEGVTRLVTQIAQAASVAVPEPAAQAASVPVPEPAVQAASVPVPEPAVQAASVPVRAADAVGVPVAAAAGVSAPVSPPEPAAWAKALAGQAAAIRDTAAGLVALRMGDLDRALAARAAADELAGRQRRLRDALRRQQDLQVAVPSVTALRAEAEAASLAAEAAPVIDAADAASAAADAASGAEAVARATLPAEYASLAAAVLRGTAGTQHDQLVRFDALGAVADRAADEDETAAAVRARARAHGDDAHRVELELGRHRETRPAAVRARETASQAASARPAARARADTARRVADGAASLVSEQETHELRRETHLQAREQAVTLRAEANRLHQMRIDGMSAELAASLFDGHECPVCGSTEHPSPKEPTFEPVSREREAAVSDLADEADQAAVTAGQEAARAKAAIDGTVARLSADGFIVPVTSAGLATAVLTAESSAADLAAEAALLDAQAAALDDAQLRVDELDQAIAVAEARHAELTGLRAAALAEAAAADLRAARHRSEVRAGLGDFPSLDEAVTATRVLSEALARAAEAADDAARTAAVSRQAADRAAGIVTEAGFSTAGEARAAFRDPSWRREAAERVMRHEAETEAVASLLADSDLAGIPLDPPAPVAEAAKAAEAAQHAHAVAVDALGEARHRAEQLAGLQPRLEAALAALAPVKERAAQIRHLADLANGTSGANQYKMTLSSFVLAARLEEVAAAASERLLTMTAGRYSLVHSDARKGNAKAGLSLLACDTWTGIDRDTATLSGGETFLASLALALGLADVVTAESAGTRMEALFVDEGFGTLDEDTLDEVMNVLDGLRAGGRIVGIVSHVSELRQRIPARVHVRKSRNGSHVEVTSG